MCQVFFNVHVYAKQKINLTWPLLMQTVLFSAPAMTKSILFMHDIVSAYFLKKKRLFFSQQFYLEFIFYQSKTCLNRI